MVTNWKNTLRVALWAAVVLLGLATTAAQATLVEGLYEATVPVAGSDATARKAAASAALAQVLLKICGSEEALELPGLRSAVAEAEGYMQQYAYESMAPPAAGLALRVEFDRQLVNRAVTESGAPLWTANRPEVLVWLVLDDGGQRRFVNRGEFPAALEALLAAFSDRGVPVRLPLYDLADSAALSPAQLWQLDSTAVARASGRYGSADVMAGRFTRLSGGDWVGDWAYFHDGGRTDRSVRGADAQALARQGAALAATAMAARYAVATSADDVQGLPMRIRGVRRYADYAAILAHLEDIELIRRAQVTGVMGDTLSLRLVSSAEATQLRPIIELSRSLRPLPRGEARTELDYQWQP